MRMAAAAAAILIALALQTTLAGLVIRGTAAIDLVLIVVVYIALKSGPVTGLLAGTVAGLIQDALSAPILGIGGLAKTLVGFLSGVLATQFILTGRCRGSCCCCWPPPCTRPSSWGSMSYWISGTSRTRCPPSSGRRSATASSGWSDSS